MSWGAWLELALASGLDQSCRETTIYWTLGAGKGQEGVIKIEFGIVLQKAAHLLQALFGFDAAYGPQQATAGGYSL